MKKKQRASFSGWGASRGLPTREDDQRWEDSKLRNPCPNAPILAASPPPEVMVEMSEKSPHTQIIIFTNNDNINTDNDSKNTTVSFNFAKPTWT